MLQFMSREQFLGIVRHVITFLGGVIVAKGRFDPALMETITGIIVSIAGVIWSTMAEEKKPPVATIKVEGPSPSETQTAVEATIRENSRT